MNELMTNYDHNLGKILVFKKNFDHILYILLLNARNLYYSAIIIVGCTLSADVNMPYTIL